MFGKQALHPIGGSRLVYWTRRVRFAHWRNQSLLVSTDGATSLEALLYSWLWLRWIPEFRRRLLAH
jgi:hypothetical protein